MKIIKKLPHNKVNIEFEDGTIIYNRQYRDFSFGEIKNYNYPSICGVGYLGKDINPINYKNQYIIWKHMIKRCYTSNPCKKDLSYLDCSVCNEWLNFTNFHHWYDENYYEIPNERMQLDKDILHKGNKIYCPECSIFVPQSINKLFTKRQNYRGKYYIGVSKISKSNKFQASCDIGNGKLQYIGSYITPLLAFNAYKIVKEKYIKQVADSYKNKYTIFPEKLYEAMYKYEVDIND